MVSCQEGPTRHAYAWQIGPFWQDTLDVSWWTCQDKGLSGLINNTHVHIYVGLDVNFSK